MDKSDFKRRDFLKVLASVSAAVMAPFHLMSCNSSKKKPNVILVITDDQGYGDLGCHGNKIIQTPNLDLLYKQSVRLTDFHVSPTCAPTRSALMTGRYCNRTGVWHTIMGRSLLRKDEITLGDLFKSGGYKTGIFGKWHLGDNYPFRPQERGFDEVMVHGGGGVGQTPDYWDNDYFDDTYLHNGVTEKYTGYCTDVWFDGAMKFIEKNKNRPFFCYIPTNAAHSPFNVDKKYSKPYLEKGVPVERARFYGMITNIDENIALLEEKIKSLGLTENTVLIFMSDNGTAAGVTVDRQGFVTDGYNAGMRGKKGSEYDGGHRVPCFIRWPGGGIEGAGDVNKLTAHIDLLPTFMDICGIEKAGKQKIDGRSLLPLLKGERENWQERILITDSQRIEHPEKWRKSAVMSDRWRLINGKELYDIKADPGQKNDIADNHPDIVKKLQDAYKEWWEDVSQKFDEYCEIILGSDNENPVRLTCHDWHLDEGSVPWHQQQIRFGVKSNGFCAVEVARSGEYELTLRRWARELNKAVDSEIPGRKNIPGVNDFAPGRALNVTSARLKIANIDETQKVQKGAHTVTFKVNLKKGKTRLQTWFTDINGESFGAYYVYVKRL